VNPRAQIALDFGAAPQADLEAEPLILALDGYEGPLHVLLALAKAQKVDLLKLSVSLLAEQYLAFVRTAGRLRFTLAAEYLVMAAWLAYLKSRLLLPKAVRPVDAEAPAEDMAAQLAFRLAKLDAMRKAAEALAARAHLGRDVFARGDPEEATVISTHRLEGDLSELMGAYVQLRVRARHQTYKPAPFAAYRLDDAREHLRLVLPGLKDWTPLTAAAPPEHRDGAWRASAVASTLSAALELAREGELEVQQAAHFTPIYLRASLRPETSPPPP
jgi:segregation and condensation protein A